MKKILLGTSAMAFAGVSATSANAATWDLDWGGYFETMVAYSSSDLATGNTSDFDGIDVIQDAEIQFTPSITLDNGLTFGVDVQLEADSQASADIIDEAVVFVTGSFGRVQIGSENSAGYTMQVAAPDVSWIGVNSGSLTAMVTGLAPGIKGRSAYGSSFTEVAGNNDANRITYFTPRFAGFQVGASYARDSSEDKNARLDVDSGTNTLHDIFDIGLNYTNSFGAFDVAASGRYGTGTVEGPGITDRSPDTWALGLNLGFSGFTVGGSYATNDNDGAGAFGLEETFYDVGVSYSTGPWGMSLTYSKSEAEVTGASAELDQYLVAATYALGPGVTAGAVIGYADYDAPGAGLAFSAADDRSIGGVVGAGDADGFTFGAGFRLGF